MKELDDLQAALDATEEPRRTRDAARDRLAQEDTPEHRAALDEAQGDLAERISALGAPAQRCPASDRDPNGRSATQTRGTRPRNRERLLVRSAERLLVQTAERTHLRPRSVACRRTDAHGEDPSRDRPPPRTGDPRLSRDRRRRTRHERQSAPWVEDRRTSTRPGPKLRMRREPSSRSHRRLNQ